MKGELGMRPPARRGLRPGGKAELKKWVRELALPAAIVFGLFVISWLACKGCANVAVAMAAEADPYAAIFALPEAKWQVWQPRQGYAVLWVGKESREKRLLMDVIETEERRVYFVVYPGFISIHSEDIWHDSLGKTFIFQEFFRDDYYDGVIDQTSRKLVILSKEGILQNLWEPTFEGSYEIPDRCTKHLDLIEEIVRWNTGEAT